MDLDWGKIWVLMYQTIHESVDVAGVFSHGKFVPKKFRWRSRECIVEAITYTGDFKDGGVRSRQYSVLVKGTLCRLLYNRETEDWFIEEVWYEG